MNQRYARVLEAARSLVSDFRQVEENFRRIAEEIVKEQTGCDERKSEIPRDALDSHDSVRESPQGRSFYGFVLLLLDPERRERFKAQVADALRLPALSPTLSADPLLPRLLPRLRVEQEKVRRFHSALDRESAPSAGIDSAGGAPACARSWSAKSATGVARARCAATTRELS